VAMYLLLLEQSVEFEAVFVDHGTDWPETYEYLDEFVKKYPVTVLKPNVQGFDSLYNLCWEKEMVPSFMSRWCTDKFKIRTLRKYCLPDPVSNHSFQFIGIDFGESHRAKMRSFNKNIENRFPLIENEITRQGCVDLIKRHGLSVPMKSGCWICPFQRPYQWKELRVLHPDLFCKAQKLEQRNMESRIRRGKSVLYLCQSPRASLTSIVEETQSKLWAVDEYPPCNCML
jgi:3'-phosphoadenosine 5'-phosphosulfate sulfotransferase (PAPS reductase)/FAD synthetase